MQKELEELDPHMWILNSPIHDYTYAAGKLQMEIQVFTDVSFRINIFEQLWEAVEISENQFG